MYLPSRVVRIGRHHLHPMGPTHTIRMRIYHLNLIIPKHIPKHTGINLHHQTWDIQVFVVHRLLPRRMNDIPGRTPLGYQVRIPRMLVIMNVFLRPTLS